MSVRRLEPRFVERVWGGPLPPLAGLRIGEVWFDGGPLLIKFLFTTEPLSVQVHPGDAYAEAHEGGSAGKTEMWHVLSATPDSWLQLGFDRSRTREEVEPAMVDGTVEKMLTRIHPQPGDTYFVPAGVVHALGPGLSICEIQQTSDVTYRLYDYNRGRPLHLKKGLEVARLEPHPGKARPVPIDGSADRIAECRYFVAERWTVDGALADAGSGVWIALDGSGTIGEHPFAGGSVFQVDGGGTIRTSGPSIWLRTYVPPAKP